MELMFLRTSSISLYLRFLSIIFSGLLWDRVHVSQKSWANSYGAKGPIRSVRTKCVLAALCSWCWDDQQMLFLIQPEEIGINWAWGLLELITQQFIHIKCLLRKSEKHAIHKEWEQYLETENYFCADSRVTISVPPMCSFVNVCSDAFVFLLRKH